ncbi:hypothetical protein DVJ78_01690 [Humibacter sp. BT305]|nr:hypothetical protein DVJ78_01690 [Humibacter sp. BT305]
MTFLLILGGFALVLAAIGAVMAVRQRQARDRVEHLDPRDVPGRGHTDGQAAAGVGHHVRGTGQGMGGGF